MLIISPEAVQAITGLVSQPEIPDGAGLRMAPTVAQDQPVIELSLAEGPKETDQVVQDQGAQIFVDDELAPQLDDKMLDATIEADQVTFTVVQQPGAGAS